ncbi:phospho-N-acetylmuramoyl-pentapeptide-transferase [Clostridium sp. JN-9]|uniref:phospho-N-acetylmuramoyl-pentapeptide- transferase n=1 Tax=Clostridium sp. JN-9 TaxID=2507159 RepID=UPI000FFE196A|nr:phospho-N-acetylmuramoyl-pentapeptide-transferase [Clostridium sp. JN-9]QAT40009.1 phospho-N-acetylmuramoyl-pentapeptide-transferase [Clostridium sp. JN-9]
MIKIVYSILVAFFISILQGPIIIPILHKLKFGQNIREEGPESHRKKTGTPTMGGIIFILSTIITILLVVRKANDEAMVALYALIAFGFIGFLDDFLKILHKKNLGLRAYQKLILLTIVSCIFAYYAATNANIGTSIIIPFLRKSVNLGWFYVPFIVFYLVAVTNAVNLTDGLDGLASSVTIIVITFFAMVSFGTGHTTLAIFCAILAGALLGFLRYNAFPAQIFMGDTGSLALGGAVAVVALILKLPLMILIVGGIYVIEAASVVIQVTSFKLTGKRVFKMSPIHHHFELSGWHETKVVSVFAITTIILCLIGFLAL